MQNIPFEKHVLVCTHEHCKSRGGEDLYLKIKEKIKKRNLKSTYRPSRVICLGQCTLGPNIAIWPDGTLYCGFKEEHIDQFIDNHLLKNEVLEDILFKKSNTI